MASSIIGVNKRYYPVQGWCEELNNEIATVAVLVAGDIGDYACYVGHGDPEWVAALGDKISFEEACAQFGPLEKEKYRL